MGLTYVYMEYGIWLGNNTAHSPTSDLDWLRVAKSVGFRGGNFNFLNGLERV